MQSSYLLLWFWLFVYHWDLVEVWTIQPCLNCQLCWWCICFVAWWVFKASSLNIMQHVSRPTHQNSHTFDLVFTLGLNLNALCIDDFFVSNHKCVSFDTVFNADTQPTKHTTYSHTFKSHPAANIFADLRKVMAFPAQTSDLAFSLLTSVCQT